jgi:pilus assembly protein CpaE
MIKVVVIAGTHEERTLVQAAVDGTSMARAVDLLNFPVNATDLIVRQAQETNADVLLVDIPHDNPSTALRALDYFQSEFPKAAIFAIGDTSQPQVIIQAMRAGAREFLPRPAHVNHLVEAFARLTSQRACKNTENRGTLYTVLNAKGGSGATTVAVNLAMALQGLHGSTALVDLAPLGHTALHLNVKPAFTVLDTIRNLHRLDADLLGSYMVRCPSGLQALAGITEPFEAEPANADFARLLDVLLNYYSHVVVDCSARYDAMTRGVCDLSHSVLLVAQTDVVSLWSASQVHNYLRTSGNRDNVRLILNRYRKASGFTETDVEQLTHTRVLWKVPNHFPLVSNAIERGTPVTQQNHSEIASSFVGLATALTGAPVPQKPKARHAWVLSRSQA